MSDLTLDALDDIDNKGISRRDFLKFSSFSLLGLSLGIFPEEAESYQNIPRYYISKDNTKIDISHLGRRKWSAEEESVIKKSKIDWKEADYKDIGTLYGTFKDRLSRFPDNPVLLSGLNCMLNLASAKKRWYNEYLNLMKENVSFMEEYNNRYINNPETSFTAGFAYDNISVEAHGNAIEHMKKSIYLAKKLPLELRYVRGDGQKSNFTMAGHRIDTLARAYYANAIRGPPNHPITWDHPLKIRGPPYDTAIELVREARLLFPENGGFKQDVIDLKKLGALK